MIDTDNQLKEWQVRRGLLLPTVLLVAACASGLKTTVDWNPEADFTAFQTYAWKPDATGGGGINQLIDSRVRTAIQGTGGLDIYPVTSFVDHELQSQGAYRTKVQWNFTPGLSTFLRFSMSTRHRWEHVCLEN